MKAVAIILSIIVFTACLVLGIQAGNSSSADLLPDGSTTITQSDTIIVQQRTLLIVGIDDLQSSDPRLTSLWVLFYRLDFPRITAIPLYPSTDEAKSQEIANTFSLDEERAPSTAFLRSLKSYDFAWTSYILIDQTATAQLIDSLNGIDLQGTTVDGTTAISSLVDPLADLPAALDSQQRFGASLCNRISQLSTDTNWLTITAALIPDHLRTDLGLEMVVSDWSALSSSSTPLTCDFPAE